jgi:hypothetical protein
VNDTEIECAGWTIKDDFNRIVNESAALKERIAFLEARRDELQASNKAYLERARTAEAENRCLRNIKRRDDFGLAPEQQSELTKELAANERLWNALILSDVNFAETYQDRVHKWMLACFTKEIAENGIERNHRFIEEALELVQACGCTQSEAHQLVDYVYGRPIGERYQEVGGVLVTLAALCSANGIDMQASGEIELTRIFGKVEQIRVKRAAKPKHPPCPKGSWITRVGGTSNEALNIRS